MREYLYIEQLSELTPWSPDAIRTMISRGVFREGTHYFKPQGRGSRPIFSWNAVKKYIERAESCAETDGSISFADGSVVDLEEADAERALQLHR